MKKSPVSQREWPISNLGSIVKFISGGTPKKDEEKYWNGIIPWVSSGEMTEGRIYNTRLNVSEDGAINGTKIAPKNTIFLVVRGMSLAKEFRISLAMRKMTFNQDVKAIYPSPTIDSIFLFYYLKSQAIPIRDSASEAAHGTKKLDMPVLEQWPVPLPSRDTQKKIAAILSTYDDLIENNKRRIALLENMAEEIYREWFVRFRFPGYQTAEFEKGIPKGWEEGAFGDITDILMGQSPKSEFYNTNGDGLPFHQGVGSYGTRFPVNEIFCSVDGRTAKQGDILFSVRAPVGRLNIANEKMIIGRGLAAISHRKRCNSYLFYLLKVAFANEDIIGNGAIFNSVGKDELRVFKIFLPPCSLVESFENLASIIDKQITVLLRSLENLDKTKNMLLPRLISGKLSVENLDIQFPPSMQDIPTAY